MCLQLPYPSSGAEATLALKDHKGRTCVRSVVQQPQWCTKPTSKKMSWCPGCSKHLAPYRLTRQPAGITFVPTSDSRSPWNQEVWEITEASHPQQLFTETDLRSCLTGSLTCASRLGPLEFSLQEAPEAYLPVALLQDTNLCVIHARKVTFLPGNCSCCGDSVGQAFGLWAQDVYPLMGM